MKEWTLVINNYQVPLNQNSWMLEICFIWKLNPDMIRTESVDTQILFLGKTEVLNTAQDLVCISSGSCSLSQWQNLVCSKNSRMWYSNHAFLSFDNALIWQIHRQINSEIKKSFSWKDSLGNFPVLHKA